jgi:hypothetical protein
VREFSWRLPWSDCCRRAPLLVVGLIQSGLPDSSPEEPLYVALAVALIMAVTMIVSLPGALIVCRKLDAPGDDFRTFE